MYPDVLFLDVTLYDIMIVLGVAAAFAVFITYAEKLKLPKQIEYLVLFSGIIGVVLGFLAATLFQSIYNYIESGVFKLKGMTFYGGLIGGAAFFLASYFLGGYLAFRKSRTPKLYLEYAMSTFGIVICSVVIAHAIGRIGCLTAGCCHGKKFADKRWYTLPINSREYAVPIPLFESLFLFGLFGFLSWRVFKKKGDALPFYMVCYGVWRFCIEYARADDRGETFLKFLTPSQLTAILMILGGIALFVIYYKVILRPKKQTE